MKNFQSSENIEMKQRIKKKSGINDNQIKKTYINDHLILEKEDNSINKITIDFKEPLREQLLQNQIKANWKK